MTVKLTISYDGTNYCGWQVQPNKPTIQSEIENAIYKITGEKVDLTGSGRTDSGVHALGQVASFVLDKDFPVERLYLALNTVLPSDIKILKSERADNDFNALKNAKRKTYRYSFYVSDVTLPLKERYYEQIEGPINFKKMKSASKLFLGEHDFKCFMATGSTVKTTVRKIYSVKLKKKNNEIYFEITGNGFLYNMVRIMAGTLLLCGRDKIDKAEIKNMLSSGNKEGRGKTLSAKGLTLISVKY